MTNTLVQKIIDSLSSGKLVAYQDIIDQFPQPANPLTVDIGQTINAIEQLAGLIQGGSISATVPPKLLPVGPIALQSVTFTLDLDKKRIDEIDCAVAFGTDGKGVGWDIAEVGTADLNVTLITLAVKWITSGDASGITAAGTGSAALGDLTLDVAVTYPQPTIACSQTGSLNVDDFFQQLGLPSVDFLKDLLIEKFKLTYSFARSQTSLSSNAVGQGGKGVPLIPDILAFDQMTFAFDSAGAEVTAGITGQLQVSAPGSGGAYLALDAKADRAANGDWAFNGSLPSSPPVTGVDLAKIFGAGASAPDPISGFTIASLSIDYAYTKKDGGSTYTINGVFTDTWSIADLSAQVSVKLSNAKDAVNVLTGKFAIEGVTFALSYTFGKDPSKFDVNIDSKVLSLSGHYAPGDGTIELSFDKVPSLAAFIGWFVGEVSGNRYYTLPDPWDSVLSDVTLQGVTFKIQLAQKKGQGSTITCSIPLNVNLLAVELDGFDVTYDPSKKSGRKSSGLSFKTKLKFGSTATTYDWDPATQPPPTIPGSKAALLDIQLLAGGQHVGFISAPATVEEAVNDLKTALDPANWTGGLLPPNTVQFSKDIGWLIGAEVVLMGQVDIKFIFNDPTIYGLSLIVNSGQSTILNTLVPLSAEIIYRKVSDTVGVYEGTLTLPDKIRQINLNQVVITLPQFSLSIYTNGDFKFDAGFPYNRDFSQSLSVVATEYSGAGGFYYAKLDGLDPSELPQVQPSDGIFSPVTEIGIGFEIGVTKSFSAGPLSASCSIMLQGIFQGVFAKYTRYSDNAQDEFFSVDATLAIVGHLVGEIDFIIITASLEITISIEVDLKLIAHQQTVATVQVSVDVELTVKINCGLFSIHIHCGYSTTLQAQATFGSPSTAIWSVSHAAAHPLLLGDAPPPTVGWQPIADTNGLTGYFIPQLTAGALYPANGQQTAWYYVGQLALSNPTIDPVTGKITSDNTDPSYANFVSGMVRWALYAFNNPAGNTATPIPRATADDHLITAADVQSLLELLKDPTSAAWPTKDYVQAQLKSAFQISVTAMAMPKDKTTANYGIGFFPAVPGMSVSVQPAGQSPISGTPVMLSRAQLRQAKTGAGANASGLRSTFLASLRDQSTAASNTTQPSPELVLIDFAVLAIRSAIGKIIEKKLIPDNSSMKIADVLTALQPELGAISGMTTRFMLHGARWSVGGVYQPLYALLAQQIPLNASALAAADLTMTLGFSQGAPGDWGMSFPGGTNTLSLSSEGTNAAVFKPKTQIPATPLFTPSNVVGAAMPLADERPAQFYLKNGIVDSADTTSLWRLPQALADYLPQGDPNAAFIVYKQAANITPPPPPVGIAAAFVFTLDFRVRKIPNTDNTYELFDVDQGGIESLQTLVTASGNLVAGLALTYAKAAPSGSKSNSRQAVITPIDFTTNNTFILQSNFSTQTNPPPHLMLAATRTETPPPSKINLFLTKLWTAGITNSGGYFLFDVTKDGQPALPDELFDASGLATLTLVADLLSSDGRQAVKLPAYVTGLQISSTDFASTDALFISSTTVETPRAFLPPGHVGVDVTRDAPIQPSGGPGVYGNALDYLYNLLTAESLSLDGSPVQYTGLPPVFGPVNQDGDKNDATTWRYRHVYPLVACWPLAPLPWPTDAVPPAQYDPYSAIGKTATFDLRWTDIFGNEWPKVGGNIDPAIPATALQYTDPLISLSQLPYLTLDYAFESQGQGAQLNLDFSLTPPSYNTGNDEADDTRKRKDLAAYAQAYYQLGDVTATIFSSLLVDNAGKPVPIPAATDTIRNNVLAIYQYLLACPIGGKPGQAPTLPSLSVSAPPNGAQIYNAIKFPLTVTLSLSRKGPVASVFADGPAKTVSMTISPYTAALGNDAHSLVPFATDFETAFQAQDLAIAVGSSAGEGLAANSRQVWVVRYGATGLAITFPTEPTDPPDPTNPAVKNPPSFAPRPLANALQSRTVTVQQIDLSNGNLIPGTPPQVAITNVDLDAQMQKFLVAVDLMFSAADAIPAALINPAAIDSLAQSKQTIVTNLINYVTDLYTGDSYGDRSYGATDPISAAADRYEQECLIRLGAFYDMDAVTVAHVTASFGGAADPGLNLFGHLDVQAAKAKDAGTAPKADDAETEFSLTSGKCVLAPAAIPMAIGVFAKNVSRYNRFACQPQFVIDAIQHDVEPVTIDGATYEVGPWLTFVRPRSEITMPPLSIPIALRAFPQPPQLMVQSAVELIADPFAPPSDGNANLQLLLAKAWALTGSYQHTYAAQDTVHLKAEINIAPPNAVHRLGAEAKRDLIDTLVDFNVNYTQLQTIFVNNHLDTIRTPAAAAKAPAALFNALHSFAVLVDAVATSNWPVKQPAPMRKRLAADILVERESLYQINDGCQDPSQTRWLCSVSWEQDLAEPVGIIPQLQIGNYKTVLDPRSPQSDTKLIYAFYDPKNPKPYLQADDAVRIPTRTVAVMPPYDYFGQSKFNPLDIVDRQSGLLSMMIGRNETLPPCFRYQTPWVTYTETISPTFDTAVDIDIGGVGQPNGQPAPRSIVDHLTALFTALVMGSGEPTPINGSFQAIAYFAYPPNASPSGAALSLVDLPIVLRLPTDIEFDAPISGTPDYVTAIAKTVTDWLTANGLSATQRSELWKRSELRFDLSLFSDASQTGRPILRLRSLFIQCKDIV
jgi:hypothetical protein